MPAPPVYLDECVDHGLAQALRRRGFTVTTAQSEGIVGIADQEQLAYADSHDLVILSHNRRHFQRCHAIFARQGRSHGGIVLLPATSPLLQLAVRAAMMLDWLASFPDHRSQLFQWGDFQYRLTQGYRPVGYTEAEVRLALGQES